MAKAIKFNTPGCVMEAELKDGCVIVRSNDWENTEVAIPVSQCKYIVTVGVVEEKPKKKDNPNKLDWTEKK